MRATRYLPALQRDGRDSLGVRLTNTPDQQSMYVIDMESTVYKPAKQGAGCDRSCVALPAVVAKKVPAY